MTEKYTEAVENHLARVIPDKQPLNLYEPVRYIMQPGGKRIRPVLVLLAAEGYGATVEEALPAAAAIEIFHNFTLLHDDIMDQAPARRGRPSVHVRWNENTAILSGDAMVYLAQQQLEKYPPEIFKKLQSLYNHTALEICEGQQEDMDFENMKEVGREQYMEMIRKKTAVLLGTSLAFGAILANVSPAEQELIYRIGVETGLAFQMMDDWLDTFGGESFGKKTGGDIVEGKKTILYVEALEKLDGKDKENFMEKYAARWDDEQEKIRWFQTFFEKTGTRQTVMETIYGYGKRILSKIEQTALQSPQKNALKSLVKALEKRQK